MYGNLCKVLVLLMNCPGFRLTWKVRINVVGENWSILLMAREKLMYIVRVA